MGWFKRKIDPMTSRSRELHSEISALESQIAQLSNASTLGDPLQIHTVLEETRYLPPDPILRADKVLTHSLQPVTDANCPDLYNDQGVRKFDLAGWWLRARRQPPLVPCPFSPRPPPFCPLRWVHIRGGTLKAVGFWWAVFQADI
ncbi:MAG: hypothetical protein HOL43_09305 [Verrucomicrobiales bacterium]|nr:hypothetical protein [Verrucomicrobiales bacterium]